MLEDKDLQSIQEVRTKIARAHEAFLKYRTYTQEQVDHIVDRMAAAACAHSEHLARLAVEETGYGNVKDKTVKNLLNCDILHQAIRPLKTVGIIREDREKGIIEIAEPVGVVAAILPTTNPTSTAIFKILIALKARNAIVVSPHPRAVRCTCATHQLLYDAAMEAGAPENIIECLGEASLAGTNELMRHRLTGMILSTGGTGIVRAAYSSGKPALGVGPGNVPVLLDSSADAAKAVASVVDGKSFDYGTVCSSEQCLIAEKSRRESVIAALKANGAYLCSDQETAALDKVLFTPELRVNADCVGQSPQRLGEMAGFSVPAETRVLVVEIKGVGREHRLSAEKLSPVLSVYFVKDFQEGLQAASSVLNFGGRGHTCVIYSNDEQRIREFGLAMPAFRVLVNTPAPQGSTGITTNVFPSMTLGCGAIAGNITGDNVGPMHLMNIKRIAYHMRDAASAFQSEESKALLAGRPLVPAASSAPVSVVPAPVAREATSSAGASKIVEAVSRYLAERGIETTAAKVAGGGAATPVGRVVANPAATVVDRFLAARGHGSSAAPDTSAGAAAAPERVAPLPNPSGNPGETAPPAPPVEVVPFVCEDDVRRAMVLRKKIFINRKTIVTPAASDLDKSANVLVRTES
jgi:acetaldehyde dehydrogenase (acetylating)